jgi:hypothetical protein
MRIDGEPVVELDFSCHHIRMLYHFLGLDPRGDLYRPARIFPKFWRSATVTPSLKAKVRKFIKKATAITLNNASRQQALDAVFGLLKKCPRDVKDVVYGLENSNPDDVLTRIEQAHPASCDTLAIRHPFLFICRSSKPKYRASRSALSSVIPPPFKKRNKLRRSTFASRAT